MPRKAPDNVNEHRLTFGTYERQAIIAPLEKTLKSVAITSQVASVAVGGGAVLAGTGLVLGAYGLWRWLGTDPFQELTDLVKDGTQKAGDLVADAIRTDAPGPIDDMADVFFEDVLGEGYLDLETAGEARKAAQANKMRYCLSGSQYYDAAQCEIATEEYRVADKRVQELYRQMRDSRAKAKQDGASKSTLDLVKAFLW
jgi:hypothetical protein